MLSHTSTALQLLKLSGSLSTGLLLRWGHRRGGDCVTGVLGGGLFQLKPLCCLLRAGHTKVIPGNDLQDPERTHAVCPGWDGVQDHGYRDGRGGCMGCHGKQRLPPTPTLTWGCQLELEELRQTLLGCNLKFVAGWAYFIHNERASSGWREKTQHYSEDHGLGRAVMQTQQ